MKKREVHTILSLLIAGVGVVLLVYMITVEDEPGGVPLLLITVGVGWFVIQRVRRQSPPR